MTDPISNPVGVVRPRVLPGPNGGRCDAANAALYMGKKPKTLAMWRMEGKGPPFHKPGGRVYYYVDDLDAFMDG